MYDVNDFRCVYIYRYSGGYHLGQLLGEIAGGFTKEDELKEVFLQFLTSNKIHQSVLRTVTKKSTFDEFLV